MHARDLPASLAVVAVGTMWGIYWLPARRLEGPALSGAWGTAIVLALAVLALAPFGLKQRRRLAAAGAAGWLSAPLGGAAFVLYANGLLYGKVAVVILLFYLTPIWSTLIGRYWMGWPVTPMRLAAIGIGFVGIALVLSGPGGPPLPHGAGEWLGLASGLLWSISSTGIRARSETDAGATAFLFVAGGAVMAVVMAPLLAGVPARGGGAGGLGETLAWIAALGFVWWGASIVLLLWAAQRLEPARVGILLMTEVLVGAVSATVIAGERFGWVEAAGGLLVIAAGTIELVPPPRRGRS